MLFARVVCARGIILLMNGVIMHKHGEMCAITHVSDTHISS